MSEFEKKYRIHELRFRWIVVAILSLTAGAKTISLFGEGLMLFQRDAVFSFLTTKQVMLTGVVIEILLIVALLICRSILLRQTLVLYTTSLFGSYHIASWLLGDTKPCSCLGGALSWLGLEGGWSYLLPYSLLLIMIGGSMVFLLLGVRRSVGRPVVVGAESSIKSVKQIEVVMVIAAFLFCDQQGAKGATDGCCAIGELRVNRYFNGKPFHDPVRNFTNGFKICIASDGRWRLELEDTIRSPGDDPRTMGGGVPVSVMAYDGSDVFYVRDQTVEKNGSELLKHSSYISSGPQLLAPNFARDGRQFIWIGFLGGRYFQDYPTANIPLPWKSARMSLLAYGFESSYTYSEEFPTLLSSLELVRDETLDLSEDDELGRETFDVPLDSSAAQLAIEELGWRNSGWANSQRAGQYTLIQATNFAGIEVPLAFRLDRTDPLRTNSPIVYECIVNKVAHFEPKVDSFRPSVTHTTIVEDSRFRHRDGSLAVNFIVYEMKAGDKWKSVSDATLTGIFDNAKQTLTKYDYRGRKRMAIVFYGLLGGALIIFGLYLGRTVLRREKGVE
jgi:hypothetical protein